MRILLISYGPYWRFSQGTQTYNVGITLQCFGTLCVSAFDVKPKEKDIPAHITQIHHWRVSYRSHKSQRLGRSEVLRFGALTVTFMSQLFPASTRRVLKALLVLQDRHFRNRHPLCESYPPPKAFCTTSDSGRFEKLHRRNLTTQNPGHGNAEFRTRSSKPAHRS